MDVTVLEDQGALRPDEVVYAQSSLRKELEVAAQLGRARAERGVQNPRAYIKKRDEASVGFAVKTKKQGSAQQVTAGVDSVAQNAFAKDFKPAYRTASEFVSNEAHLRLGDQQVDV